MTAPPPLPSLGSRDWFGWAQGTDGAVRALLAGGTGGGGGVGETTLRPVTAFGAGADKTPAQNDAAFAAALASGAPLFVPAAATPYRISAPIDLRGRPGATLRGANPETAVIQQQTSNVPIVRLGGGLTTRFQQLADLRLQYATEQPAANTGANGIELDRAYIARIDRVHIYRAARGIHTPASDDGGGVQKAYAFQNVISNVHVSDYSHTAVSLVSTANTSSTGNILDNVYTIAVADAGTDSTVQRAFHYYGHDATVLRNINVERARFAQEAVLFDSVKNAVVDSLHYEGVTQVAYGMGLLCLYGDVSRMTLRGMDVHICTFDAAADTAPIFKVGGALEFDAYGVHTYGNTRTAPNVPLFFTYDTAAGSIRLRGYESNDGLVTVEQSGFPAARVPVVKQINESLRHWQEGGGDVVLGTAAPTTGTWPRGSKVINSAPAAAAPQGWVCVTAGTPGTWRPMPNL